jgi:hypothetical protein
VTTTEFTRNSRIFCVATYTGSEGETIATLKVESVVPLSIQTFCWQLRENSQNKQILYFVLSVTMVDREGLNIRSLRVSMKAEGAVCKQLKP